VYGDFEDICKRNNSRAFSYNRITYILQKFHDILVGNSILFGVVPSPAMKVIVAVKKAQLSTLTTVYPIFSPTVHSLLFLNIIF
jgi:hypothetical protein